LPRYRSDARAGPIVCPYGCHKQCFRIRDLSSIAAGSDDCPLRSRV
jgi:hypothetical protein